MKEKEISQLAVLNSLSVLKKWVKESTMSAEQRKMTYEKIEQVTDYVVQTTVNSDYKKWKENYMEAKPGEYAEREEYEKGVCDEPPQWWKIPPTAEDFDKMTPEERRDAVLASDGADKYCEECGCPLCRECGCCHAKSGCGLSYEISYQ